MIQINGHSKILSVLTTEEGYTACVVEPAFAMRLLACLPSRDMGVIDSIWTSNADGAAHKFVALRTMGEEVLDQVMRERAYRTHTHTVNTIMDVAFDCDILVLPTFSPGDDPMVFDSFDEFLESTGMVTHFCAGDPVAEEMTLRAYVEMVEE